MEEKKFKRNCPLCNAEISYTYKSDLTKALKNNTNCKKCATSLSGNKFKKGHNLNDLRVRKNSLDRLIDEESIESFYWIGFIIADGSLHSGSKFEFGLAEKDKNVLDEFAKFINLNGEIVYRESTKSYRIAFSNSKSIPNFMSKYGFNFKKTYNPTNFDVFKIYSKELLISLLIGIIDGDGNIENNGSSGAFAIHIKSHNSWQLFYENFLDYLEIPYTINNINNTNTIRINIFRREYILTLNNFINNNNLFHLNRKWDKIK